MTEKDIKKIIDRSINTAIGRLKSEGIINNRRRTVEDKVAELLENYPAFKRVERESDSISKTTARIEAALKTIRTDPYYQVIERTYFEGQTRDLIALQMGCRPETVSRNKKRLLRELAPLLFPDDVLHNINNA